MISRELVQEAGLHVQRQRSTGQRWKSYPWCRCGWRGLEWNINASAWRQANAHYLADHFERKHEPPDTEAGK